MSYDLMVFEPEAPPQDHVAFMDWYFTLTKWNDGPYDDPAQTSARLRAWVQEMQRTFPDMNTPEAEIHLQDDDGRFCIGPLSCEKGDEIWIIGGAKEPYLLREVSRGKYILLGQVYIHGIMDGELADKGLLQEVTQITLV